MLAHSSSAFALICHCCRWPRSEASLAAIRHAAAAAEWDRVMPMVMRHRVAGLVYDGLRAAGVEPPPHVATKLGKAANEAAMRGIQLAAELGRLVTLLESAGVRVAVLKGSPLAMLAYGKLGLKGAIDIDLAVLPSDRTQSEILLRDAGYAPQPSGSDKHSRWMAPRSRTIVELHHALTDVRPWLAGLSAADATRRVPLGGGTTAPTFEQDDLVAYLCVHGASHGWSRLKWLSDLAASLAPLGPAAAEQAYRHARQIGAGRCVAQGLLLASEFLGLQLQPSFERELRANRVHRWLVVLARRTFTGAHEGTELDERTFAKLPIHLSHLLLGMRKRDVMPALADKLGAPARLAARLGRG